ncbi:MAG: hypothetical protein E7388_04415 [Ruminococcaceae bacterium]|nr:hypothetical protein [Oscillospiraceae bacterium]
MTFFENPLTVNELARLGENLALAERVTKLRGKVPENIREIKSILQIIKNTCGRINKKGGVRLPGEEWISDNQVSVEIKTQELMAGFVQNKSIKLPLVRSEGRLLPRVAILAREIANHTAGGVTYEAVTAFLEGYCKISGLSTDELYMFKYYLQLAVLRRIATACMIMDFRAEERGQALKVYGLLKQYLEGRGNCKALELWLSDIKEITPAFCTALLRKAAEEGDDTEEYRKILEKKLQGRFTTLDALSEQEYRMRFTLGSGLGNSITAMGAIPAFNWREIVERESAVMNILSKDPSGVFGRMNSGSKMAYVRAVEQLAAKRKISPEAVASEAVEKAVNSEENTHVGVYIKSKKKDLSFLFLAFCGVFTVALAFAPSVKLFMTAYGIILIPPLLILCRNIVVRLVEARTGVRSPSQLPGLDFSKGIPPESSVMVVMPVLLMDGGHVKDAFRQLESIYCGNRGENIYFTLTGDLCDSDTQFRDMDGEIIRTGKECVSRLNKKYGEKFFFHCRERFWSETQQKWICRERKRGALIEFNNRIVGKYAFVLTIDDGTLVPPGSISKMAEIMAHPLNKEYGILQPEIGTVPFEEKASQYSELFASTWGRSAYGGNGGFYFNLCGQGSYTGKGMYDPVKFNIVLKDLFPDERILSHDLIEGCFMGCATTGEATLFETFPSKMDQDMKRQHRWTRGDWQLLPYLRRSFTDKNGRRRKNPLSPICRFKIRDNMLRSLVPGSLVFLSIGCLYFPEALWYTVPVVLLSIFLKFLISPSVKSFKRSVVSFVLAPYMAYLMTDAAIRALWRLYVSKKNLLEWVTSAQISRTGVRSPSQKKQGNCPSVNKLFYLREARKIWAFYEDYVTENDNFLPPDNVQFEPVYAVAHRTSPTNIGFYLLACLEAYRLGFISKTELIERVGNTLSTLEKITKYKGHLYNWYDTISLSVLSPKFVSSVDSGNLCACLITLKQGLEDIDPSENFMNPTAAQVTKELINENPEMWQPKHRKAVMEMSKEDENTKNPQWRREFYKTGVRPHVLKIEQILSKMCFDFLMDPGRMLLYTGFDVDKKIPTNSFYDMAASEARLTSYIAIAKGDLPAEHFDRPLRKFGNKGKGVLQSWSGTGFEFYMPELFFRGWSGTLWDMTIKHVTKAQRDFSKRKGLPWGISESGYNSQDVNLNYKYKAFGVPGLGMKQAAVYPPVISPYTSLMIADRYPSCVFDNLKKLSQEGANGRYGFVEAVDFTPERAGVVNSFMAHHVGMALSGLTNLLADEYIRKTFTKDPAMAECRILLAETPPKGYGKAETEWFSSVKSPTFKKEIATLPVTAELVPLSNGRYTCYAGGDGWNRSFCDGVELTKEGISVIVNEAEEGLYFSIGKIPVATKPHEYKSFVSPYYCTIKRRDGNLESKMDTFVSPVDDAEIRHITITNCGNSYLSPVISVKCRPALNRREAWQDHPTYSDLFITEEKPKENVTIFRSALTGKSAFLVVTPKTGSITPKTGGRPPSLAPGETLEVYVTLGTGENYEKYVSFDNCSRDGGLPPVLGAVEKETIGIDENQLNYFINLTEHIIRESEGTKYTDGFYRHKDVVAGLKNWGISGDKPIVAVFVTRMEQIGFVKKMVKFREFLNFRKVPVDMVFSAPDSMEQIIREETGTFFNGEQDCLVACATLILKPGKESELPGREPVYRDTFYRPVPFWDTGEKPEFKASLIGGLEFFNGFGGFMNRGKEYVIMGRQPTPAPWINCISNKEFGFTISADGCGTVWNLNSKENRITPWNCDKENQTPEEVIFISPVGENRYFTATPGGNRENYVTIHGIGKTKFLCKTREIETDLSVFTPVDSPAKYSVLNISNLTSEPMELDIVYRVKLNKPKRPYQIICSKEDNAVLFNCFRMDFYGAMTTFVSCSTGIVSFTCDEKECYDGAKNFTSEEGISKGPVGAIHTRVKIPAGDLTPVLFVLGQSYDDVVKKDILRQMMSYQNVMAELSRVDNYWNGILNSIEISTPDKALNYMVNSRLLYQVISCRLWGRTAFYQSGGAIGFRDQLQDSLALLLTKPEMTREQILIHCAHQFKEGDVQHWWHPPVGSGVRTRCSDDLLWLPYAVYEYVKVTGDDSILFEEVPYLESPELESGQQDRYETPSVSDTKDTVFNHCVKAVERACRFGEHGIPLIGSCDWNDGMSTVGISGKGESVWLAWFLCVVADRMAELCKKMGKSGKFYSELAGKMSETVEKNGWKTDHYIRAFYDSGRPMEVVDAISQAWAVISGRCNPERGKIALATAERELVDKENGLIKLLTPSFNKENTKEDHPGYIAFYPEGIRENGGQYTHGVLWFIKALFLVGEQDKAYELLNMINPINHSLTGADANRYKVEPYVVSADVYSAGKMTGQGGWSWYTGSAAWMYKVITEDLLGITLTGGKLDFKPSLPSHWHSYRIKGNIGGKKIDVVVKR